jgi:effector-binding domain-containing protein
MTDYQVEERTLGSQDTAVLVDDLTVEEMGPFLEKAFATVSEYLAKHGSAPAGPPFARFHHAIGARFRTEAGFPTRTPVEEDGVVHRGSLPGGRVATTWHVGPHRRVGRAHAAVYERLDSQGRRPCGDAWEVYVGDAVGRLDSAGLRTLVVQPFVDAVIPERRRP